MAEPGAPVIVPGPLAGRSSAELRHRLTTASYQAATTRARTIALLRKVRCALAEDRFLTLVIKEAVRGWQSAPALSASLDRSAPGPALPEPLNRSEHARMAARLQTMPVIESARPGAAERDITDLLGTGIAAGVASPYRA